jgi:hypothetical protein
MAIAVLSFVLLAVFIFAVAPNLVWIIIGAQELNNKCNFISTGPNLAVWLIVEGSVGLFATIFGVALTMIKAGLWGFVLATVLNLFFLAWWVIGIVRLCDDIVCERFGSRLYNTAAAAIIVGFLSLLLNLAQSGLGLGKRVKD